MAERDYAELSKQYALGKTIQRQHFSNTWYDLNKDDLDEHGNIIFDDRDGYRVKPSFELDSGIIGMTSNILYALRKIGYSCKDTCASIPNGIVRVKDGPGNIWRITITKE
jgi:hypothetical protein